MAIERGEIGKWLCAIRGADPTLAHLPSNFFLIATEK
jgi:hypothetical protein